jgi:hypothetical protein
VGRPRTVVAGLHELVDVVAGRLRGCLHRAADLGPHGRAGVLLSLTWTTTLTDTEFRVGRARLPLDVVDGVDVVARGERRAALGPGLDARAHLAIRSWIPTAVRIHLGDPTDPTPYWVVSTRQPQRLAAEIRRRSRCR